MSVCVCVCGGGGGYSHFFFIRRIGPSIYRLPPKKIGNIKHPKKIFYFFATQKYSLSVHLPLEKTLKYIEKTPKTSPILSWPLKNILKSSYPQNIHFLKPPKNNVIEKFKQKKCPEPTHESNDQSTPPPPPCGPWSLWGCKFSNLPKCVDYLRFVPFSKSEILEIIPTLLKSSWLVTPVSDRRIGQYHESDFVLPGKLVDKGPWPHSMYTSAACW